MLKDLFRLRISLVAALLVSLVWLGCADNQSPLTAPDDLEPDILVVSQDAFGLAIAAQENHTPRLLTTRGLIGTAVGLAENGQPVVKLFVATEGVGGLPVSLDGIPVVVEVTGEIFALRQEGRRCATPPCGGGGGGGGGGEEDPSPVDRTARLRPAPIGVSTGHPSITAGTIGARVTDAGGDVYALSNNHVYAASNSASLNDPVIQPGTFDGGSLPGDKIGTLADFVEIDFSGGDNVVDAAIARVDPLDLLNTTPTDGYGEPSSETASAAANMRVMKYGRTTGQTKGRVRGFNATVRVNYGAPGVAVFIHQIVIGGGGFSAGGDSGSLVVTESNASPVGLLFAGSNSVTIANPIGAVLTAFGVTIDGNDGN